MIFVESTMHTCQTIGVSIVHHLAREVLPDGLTFVCMNTYHNCNIGLCHSLISSCTLHGHICLEWKAPVDLL